jgi:uncharacterized membrane protein YgdD (TMEM256/DUF423 family)
LPAGVVCTPCGGLSGTVFLVGWLGMARTLAENTVPGRPMSM